MEWEQDTGRPTASIGYAGVFISSLLGPYKQILEPWSYGLVVATKQVGLQPKQNSMTGKRDKNTGATSSMNPLIYFNPPLCFCLFLFTFKFDFLYQVVNR